MRTKKAWRAIASCGALVAAACTGCGSDDSNATSPASIPDSGADATRVATGDDAGPSTGDDDTALDASEPEDASDAKAAMGSADASDSAVDGGAGAALQHVSFDGVVNVVRHIGTSWYIGGGFTRASSHPAGNVLALDTTGAPASCPLGVGFDGRINTVAQAGTSIYVGGEFASYQGTPVARIAKIDATTCALDTTFTPALADNGFDAEPTALAVSGTSLYVGGQFSAYRGVADSANHLAKLDLTSGALDTTFAPNGATANGFDGDVAALVVTKGSLYVGGAFSAYRGAANSAHRLAKLNLTTGALDTTFSPNGASANGFDGAVDALAASATSLYVGGAFTAYKGTASSANLVAKLDPSTGALDSTFSPVGASSNGFSGTTTRTASPAVLALAYVGTSLYVGGRFTSYRGAASAGTANRIAKIDGVSGTLDTTFSPMPGGAGANGFDNTVEALATNGTSLFVGGLFSAYRGVASSAQAFAKLDLATGAQDTTYISPGESDNGVSGSITSEVFAGTTLWIAGAFTLYGGASVNGLAKLDDATYAVDTVFSPPASNGVDGAVFALATGGTSLYVGGAFDGYRGAAGNANTLAKVDLTTGALDTTFSPAGALANGFTVDGAALSGQVDALAVSATSLYVGGTFDEYRGVAHSSNDIAKLDLTSGALDTTFTPPGATANGFDVAGSVQALVVAGTSVYVGGDFTKYKNVTGSANNLAKLDAASGAIDTTFSPVASGGAANGFDGVVFALVASATDLYIGGNFDAYRGVASSAIDLAKVDLTTGALDTRFSPNGATANGFGSNGPVSALALGNGSLYAAGAFTDYRGVADSANHLAKLDPTSGAIDTAFSPVTANGVDGPAYAIDVSSRAVALGGQFAVYRNATTLRANLDFLDPTSGAPLE